MNYIFIKFPVIKLGTAVAMVEKDQVNENF